MNQIIDFGAWNVVDWVILGVLIVTIALGLWWGFIRSIMVIVVIYVGWLLASLFGQDLSALGSTNFSWYPTGNLGIFIADVVIFILAIIVGFLLLRVIVPLLRKIPLFGWLDKTAGLIIGAIAGFIVLFFLATYTYPTGNDSTELDPVQGLVSDFADTQVQTQFSNSQLLPSFVGASEVVPDSVLDLAPTDSAETLRRIQEDPTISP